VTVPDRAVDAQSVIAAADAVVSAGGTMNREAVALGTPVYTTFSGRLGAVDEQLIRAGRLTQLDDPGELDLDALPPRGERLRRDPNLLLDLLLGERG
jgi:predicted glycosyltransferase